jgi:hypothetical protein
LLRGGELRKTAPAQRLIVAKAAAVLENRMVRDQTRFACQIAARIVIDDRARLPGRFFGRLTSAGLARAA